MVPSSFIPHDDQSHVGKTLDMGRYIVVQQGVAALQVCWTVVTGTAAVENVFLTIVGKVH